jgi:uncharacterized protein (TIGR02118 family)
MASADADTDYDGMAEMWFDSEQAMRDAFVSEAGKRVVADALAHAKRRLGLTTIETEITL